MTNWAAKPRPAQAYAHASRRAAGIVVFSVPPSAPSVGCVKCGWPVIWIDLPTGGRLAVGAESHEAHEAICPGPLIE